MGIVGAMAKATFNITALYIDGWNIAKASALQLVQQAKAGGKVKYLFIRKSILLPIHRPP